MKTNVKVFLALCVLLMSACDRGPSLRKLEIEFNSRNPTATIKKIVVGEGDASCVYYHIKYKENLSEVVKEQVWQYMNYGGNWKLENIESK